jgi:hypothetical protein
MLTGKPPYDEEDIAKTHAEKLSNKIELPTSLNPNIPKKLEKFILKALEMEDELFISAQQMLEELYEAFSEIQSFSLFIVNEIRNDKKIKREIQMNETFNVKLTEIYAPIFVSSGSDGEVILKFNNNFDLIFDINFNPGTSFQTSYKNNEFSIRFQTQKDYYGVINLKIQIKDKLSNHLLKNPIEIPILVLPTENIEKEVKF